MLRTNVLALAVAAFFSTAATAQFCSDNLYPAQLVTQQGLAIPRATDQATGLSHFAATSEGVYLAFPATIPSGTYYVFVTTH